jgi:hypothetical protein
VLSLFEISGCSLKLRNDRHWLQKRLRNQLRIEIPITIHSFSFEMKIPITIKIVDWGLDREYRDDDNGPWNYEYSLQLYLLRTTLIAPKLLAQQFPLETYL